MNGSVVTVRKVSMKRNISINILTTDTPIYLIWYDASCSIQLNFLSINVQITSYRKKPVSTFQKVQIGLDSNNQNATSHNILNGCCIL